MANLTHLHLPPMMNAVIGIIDKGIDLLPIDFKVLAEEEYQVAETPVARKNYDMIMNSFEKNKGKVTHNWLDAAVTLGKQVQIDLRNGHTITDIMPVDASVTAAQQGAGNRVSDVMASLGPEAPSVVGHFFNMIQFLVSTSVHGQEIYDWFGENNPKSHYRLASPEFSI